MATTELCRSSTQARAQIYLPTSFACSNFRPLPGYTVDQERNGNVLNRVESRQQIEKLKYKADRHTSKASSLVLLHAHQILALHLAMTGILAQNRGNDRDQGGLPAP